MSASHQQSVSELQMTSAPFALNFFSMFLFWFVFYVATSQSKDVFLHISVRLRKGWCSWPFEFLHSAVHRKKIHAGLLLRRSTVSSQGVCFVFCHFFHRKMQMCRLWVESKHPIPALQPIKSSAHIEIWFPFRKTHRFVTWWYEWGCPSYPKSTYK